jgi:hypothetical protein
VPEFVEVLHQGGGSCFILGGDRHHTPQRRPLLQEHDRDAVIGDGANPSCEVRVKPVVADNQPVGSTLIHDSLSDALGLSGPRQQDVYVVARGMRGGSRTVQELCVKRIVQAKRVGVLKQEGSGARLL